MKVEQWQLDQRQGLSFEAKIARSAEVIRKWYEHCEGKVYVSFSGGKDSTVLLDLVRSIYPDVLAVFADTGLEYPEIREFIQQIDNVVWLKPKMTFREVLDKYGYPVVSKQVSMAISRYRNTKSDVQKKLRLYGGVNPSTGKKQVMGVIPKKWHFLVKAPFKISEQCCYQFKINVFERYEKKSGNSPYMGTMASDSRMRKVNYLQHGCNAYDLKKRQSRPLSFWKEEDIWTYINKKGLAYSKIYDMGEKRTGCMFCMFGMHMSDGDRFERMKKTHLKMYDYCMDKLKMREVIDYVKKENG